MVYRLDHWQVNDNCKENECKYLATYVRIDGKWEKIGYFGTICKSFELLDLEKERTEKEQDRKSKENLALIRAEIRQAKQEGRETLKIIKNELKVNKSFFK